MSYEVELYRGSDFALAGRIPLFPLLREALSGSVGLDMRRALIRLLLLPVPDEAELDGAPPIYNLMPDYGYGTVRVYEGARLLYRHPHTLRELIAEPLRERLREEYPEVTQWGFLVVGPGLPRAIVRPTPRVQGLTHVDPYDEGEGPTFRIRRVPDPEPPPAALGTFGLTSRDEATERTAFAKVLVREEVERDLTERRRFSTDVEEGGFLLGRVYQDREAAGTYLLE
ncbi:MAG TPA: JAB N-terminal domain-containing protein, partial [Thermoanaerobaculia bacterium]|nr:JAB N-terminal domain-containing protein [Thermoanaerobaculia bacterium]